MVKFEKVTRGVLMYLKKKGYNILTSNNEVIDSVIYWFPERIDSTRGYMRYLNNLGYEPPLSQPTLLRIEEALEKVKEEEEVEGYIFIAT
ncbi:hypothetical protein [Sphingobacterium paucimobilis]|uniref:Uncharacterized protein n=1 Tax=Sphingobacterium paucimobilis HER1398 TaxID=1346330 RepID=U2IXI2_9SPHI|nr:hypothetical protein [Sphingobacterium paucimobilis]ERJ57414.1 hypothetical protein M472_01410 [Sphingobacterium paucimobilis HER1398]